MTTKMTAYVFLCLSALLGTGSLAAYMLFLFFGSLNLIDLGLSESTALGLNSCLCLAFFIQHSGMTRQSFRRWLEKYMKKAFHLFSLLFIWSCPDLTADRLLFNILFTSWIIIGILLEERDLVSDFGEEYLDYKRRVPMLIPYRWKKG